MSSWLEMVSDAWEKAGRPPYREVAKGAVVNHETARQALNGSRVVSEKTAERLARYLLEPADADIAINLWKASTDEAYPTRRKRPHVPVHPAEAEVRKRFRAYRQNILKIQQKELARRLGQSSAYASELELYDQNHSLAVYSKWADALGIEFGLYMVLDGDFQTINCTDVEDSAGQ